MRVVTIYVDREGTGFICSHLLKMEVRMVPVQPCPQNDPTNGIIMIKLSYRVLIMAKNQ